MFLYIIPRESCWLLHYTDLYPSCRTPTYPVSSPYRPRYNITLYYITVLYYIILYYQYISVTLGVVSMVTRMPKRLHLLPPGHFPTVNFLISPTETVTPYPHNILLLYSILITLYVILLWISHIQWLCICPLLLCYLCLWSSSPVCYVL